MAEQNNPLTKRIKKMAAILEAAKKAAEKVEEEKLKAGPGGTGQSSPQGG